MAKIKFLKSHHEFAYFAGDIAQVDDDKAAELLNRGYAIILPEDGGDDIVNTLPEDLPGRVALFAAGFETPEAVKEAGDSILDVEGVGKGTLKQIEAYFKNLAK